MQSEHNIPDLVFGNILDLVFGNIPDLVFGNILDLVFGFKHRLAANLTGAKCGWSLPLIWHMPGEPLYNNPDEFIRAIKMR